MENENKKYISSPFAKTYNRDSNSSQVSASEDKQYHNHHDTDFNRRQRKTHCEATHESENGTLQDQKSTSHTYHSSINLDDLEYKNWTATDLIARIRESEKKLNSLETYYQNTISNMQSNCFDNTEKTQISLKKKKKKFDFSKYKTRCIALKVSYFGWNYDKVVLEMANNAVGETSFHLSGDSSSNLYVEQVLFEAMIKSKMIPHDANVDSINFKRVDISEPKTAALCQIYTVNSRTVFEKFEDMENPDSDSKEMDYVGILNQILPSDIRIRAVCLHLPSEFSLEESIEHKHYHYFFKMATGKYDEKKFQLIEKLRGITKRYIGSYDFKNFCQIYNDKICKAHISDISCVHLLEFNNDVFAISFKGTNTTMTQIQSMGDLALRIALGLEDCNVIDYLLGKTTPWTNMVNMESKKVSLRRPESYGWIVLSDITFSDRYEFNWREPTDMDFRFNECYFDRSLKKHIQRMFAESFFEKKHPPLSYFMDPIGRLSGLAAVYTSNLEEPAVCVSSSKTDGSENDKIYKRLKKNPKIIQEAEDVDESLYRKDGMDRSLSMIMACCR